MYQVKLVVFEGPDCTYISQGIFYLHVIPRIGESVMYERESDDGPMAYEVKNIVHHIEPSRVEVWMVSLENLKYYV